MTQSYWAFEYHVLLVFAYGQIVVFFKIFIIFQKLLWDADHVLRWFFLNNSVEQLYIESLQLTII
jgi:hypothetical protein